VLRTRIIPVLLISDDYIVKTTRFSNPRYIGDPINIVRIFNEKEVDELTLFDIGIKGKDEINYNLIKNIAFNARMPICYGGGIRTIAQVEKIFSMGIEKISISKSFILNPILLSEIASKFGSQSTVVTFDINRINKDEFCVGGNLICNIEKIKQLIVQANNSGAGEIIINCIHRDGTDEGYDQDLLDKIYFTAKSPITIVGGASSLENIFTVAKKYPVIGLGVGNLFIYKGKKKAVLISYPGDHERKLIQ
tara:strand:- start:3528 stop:4277 length:750 start_codon:yes stop_codon:yes gene_type:complete